MDGKYPDPDYTPLGEGVCLFSLFLKKNLLNESFRKHYGTLNCDVTGEIYIEIIFGGIIGISQNLCVQHCHAYMVLSSCVFIHLIVCATHLDVTLLYLFTYCFLPKILLLENGIICLLNHIYCH